MHLLTALFTNGNFACPDMLHVSWNTAPWLGGCCQGSGSLFIRLLGKHPEPHDDGSKARTGA